MVGEFLESWPVMRDAAAAAWLAAALLSVAGVIVLVREQPFLGAALAQASTLGFVLAPPLAATLHAEQTALLGGAGFEHALAVVFAGTAAIVLERGFEREAQSRSAATAYGFLLATALSLLVAARRPEARAEAERLLTSSSVEAGPVEVALLALAL